MGTVRQEVGLLGTVEVLHKHLTGALCESVFSAGRVTERRRLWTLQCLAEFWTAVILRAPDSLRQALEEASKGAAGFPLVEASPQAFFSRCKDLRWEFFRDLFEAFTARVLAKETPRFAEDLREVGSRFSGIWVVDGSALDAVAHRLKVLWDERAVVLPGCMTVFYDLFHGVPRILSFHEKAMEGELVRVEESLPQVPQGTLVVGDRAFGVARFFQSLETHGLFGLARHAKTVQIRRLRVLSRRDQEGSVVEDSLVEAGTGANGVSVQTLRCVLWRKDRKVLRLLTNVLDPKRLSPTEALALYRRRWKVERMFYDLKEVLNLHRFYAANTNAVAMQIYAAAIVYVAMRTAQGRIAKALHRLPEAISPEKLFPRVAAASHTLTAYQTAFLHTKGYNRGVRLREPPWAKLREFLVSEKAILAEPRKPKRRKRRYCRARRMHVSLRDFTPRRRR